MTIHIENTKLNSKQVKELVSKNIISGKRHDYWVNAEKQFLGSGSVSDFRMYVSINGDMYIRHYWEEI